VTYPALSEVTTWRYSEHYALTSPRGDGFVAKVNKKHEVTVHIQACHLSLVFDYVFYSHVACDNI
jgi:hypothetical protein